MRGTLNSRATAAVDSGRRLQTATIATPSSASSPGMCRNRVLAPAPIKPTRMRWVMAVSPSPLLPVAVSLPAYNNKKKAREFHVHLGLSPCERRRRTREARRAMTVPDFMAAKTRGVRLTMLTAYDYTMARLLDDAGVDAILVGDSLGMVVQGEPARPARHPRRDDLSHPARCARRAPQLARRRLAVHELPGQPEASARRVRGGSSRKGAPRRSSSKGANAAPPPSRRSSGPTSPSWGTSA